MFKKISCRFYNLMMLSSCSSISGSGVTGATPPLSNLNFVTTTAAVSSPLMPTSLSRDAGSSVVSTTMTSTSTVTATGTISSPQAAEGSGNITSTASDSPAPDMGSGMTASQDAMGTLGGLCTVKTSILIFF